MPCLGCGASLHDECESIDNDGKCCCLNKTIDEEDEDDNWRKPRRQGKREATLKDQQSTGRKRAARLYPLNPEGECEWRNLKLAGGGKYPVVGCRNGSQQARHHGPDKNTLNNDKGNVHRICHVCHNRWHALNDSSYVAGEIENKHDSETKATAEDFLAAEIYFSRNKPKKVGKD